MVDSLHAFYAIYVVSAKRQLPSTTNVQGLLRPFDFKLLGIFGLSLHYHMQVLTLWSSPAMDLALSLSPSAALKQEVR